MKGHDFMVVLMGADAEVGDASAGGIKKNAVWYENRDGVLFKLGQLSQGGFGRGYDLAKTGWIVNRNFRKHLAVQGDAGFGCAFDEAAVADLVELASGGKTLDPKSAEIAFAVLAVAKVQRHGAIDGFGGHTKAFAAASIKSFG